MPATTRRTRALGALLTLGFIVGGLFAASPLPPATPAQAAPVVGFKAGNIISDQLFFNGNAMTAAEVQSFLNKQVPRCTIGDPGRKPGSAWENTKIATTCLRNYSSATKSRPATEFCGAYSGAAKETAAQILAKAGKACGISQKVLLVLLEKEQSLVSDSWPTVLQFQSATGFGCPDTAACSSASYGLVEQLYNAASQFQRYAKYPKQYRHQPKATNNVYWHPSDLEPEKWGYTCGTGPVFIENKATAGLYNYTPYQPNQSAINAGWGTGDRCASYGNRNFYSFYTLWFGSTQSIEVHANLQKLYASLGGATGRYQKPTATAVAGPGGGIRQEFQGGTLYWSKNTGAAAVAGGIRGHFNSSGGAGGKYGYPKGTERRYADGSYSQDFYAGQVFWRPSGTVTAVMGATRGVYLREGGATGHLGFPTGSASTGSNGRMKQSFERGVLSWVPRSGEFTQYGSSSSSTRK
ncbi:LGFP repeat-containing protein [Leucobacter sp. M11]|uniref:LGFP repeat-containing protein n=1 Tax=Leucobacter sp. M11 TaxID=2993565 RepID=UPI002D7EBFDF|nr:hypothetical protein [Leucobacter sp. M11]MEB4615411.1 hypothetical protein [Leucobacter sp. M11]